jgi:hypothetical protein
MQLLSMNVTTAALQQEPSSDGRYACSGFTSNTTPATTNAIVANHCSTLIALSITLSS